MGTHLRVLSESYPMNTNMSGFRWFFKNLCILVLWTKVASALEGLNINEIVRLLLEAVSIKGLSVFYHLFFVDDLGICHKFTKCLKGGCGCGVDTHFSFKHFPKMLWLKKIPTNCLPCAVLEQKFSINQFLKE